MTGQIPNANLYGCGFDGMDLDAETVGHNNNAGRAITSSVLMLLVQDQTRYCVAWSGHLKETHLMRF
jgi:hypothetical protein